jgi:branched-chain amino acid transport system permease protein
MRPARRWWLAALGLFIVGFRTRDIGQGLFFDYQLTDLAIAVVTIFFGRLGLQLASIGLKWPAFALGAALGAVGAAPLSLPSTFLHWFVVIAGVLIILRTIWPWANAAMARARHSRRGAALGQGRPSGSARPCCSPPC